MEQNKQTLLCCGGKIFINHVSDLRTDKDLRI